MDTLRDPAPRRVLLAVDQRSTATGRSTRRSGSPEPTAPSSIVLSVVERSNLHLPGGLTRRVDQERDRLAAGARSIVDRAREAGVAATYLIWEGDPAETILEASNAEGADVIVLGSRPRTDLRKLFLGSVSSHVTRTAPCRVIVVPN